jgi:hypothetical protein
MDFGLDPRYRQLESNSIRHDQHGSHRVPRTTFRVDGKRLW